MKLPSPVVGNEAQWVTEHLGHLTCDTPSPSPRFRGTQAAADAALAAFDVTGYAAKRNEVWPPARRGASALSPWIRHGLLTLPVAWDAVEHGPAGDRTKFRDELLWQEFARHLYARLGSSMQRPLRHLAPPVAATGREWDRSMNCLSAVLDELEGDGWLVNQTRMWLAGDWSVRHGSDWTIGEQHFFTHLLDGSRAANRAGWQWTVGTATGRPYGFSRWQVTKRAPALCRTCVHATNCPIEQWPDAPVGQRIEPDPLLWRDPDAHRTAGPVAVQRTTAEDGRTPRATAVWLTAESLGDNDPALAANPGLPVIFVFDAPLLARLQLSGKRLVFLAERLAELAAQADLAVHLGDPVEVLVTRPLAATFTPVPGWRRRAEELDLVEIHPWPWLRRPGTGSLTSYSTWSSAREGRKGATTRLDISRREVVRRRGG